MIFYFSATGNTRWAARKVAQITGEKLYSIPDVVKSQYAYTLERDERIGFMFPIHGWRPPLFVRKFIGNLKLTTCQHSDSLSAHYCYALCTAGDDIGQAMDYLNEDLATIGLHTHATFSLKMPNTYVGLPFMNVDTKEVTTEKRQQATALLQTYCGQIYDREHCVNRMYLSHWPWINSKILGSYFVNRLITDKPFHVEKQRCVKCGICANVCPTSNIEGGHGQIPVWKHNNSCLTCFACYHYCPHHAIEFGKQTRNKEQYFFR